MQITVLEKRGLDCWNLPTEEEVLTAANDPWYDEKDKGKIDILSLRKSFGTDDIDEDVPSVF